MTGTPRVAFLHTGAVVIAPVADLARQHLGAATTVNYLDDKIVADLGDADLAASVPERIADLVQAAKSAGADIVMLTCSSISQLAAPTAERIGIPVLRIDEAMADQAVSLGSRIAVPGDTPDDADSDVGADPGACGAGRCVTGHHQRRDQRRVRGRLRRRSTDARPAGGGGDRAIVDRERESFARLYYVDVLLEARPPRRSYVGRSPATARTPPRRATRRSQ